MEDKEIRRALEAQGLDSNDPELVKAIAISAEAIMKVTGAKEVRYPSRRRELVWIRTKVAIRRWLHRLGWHDRIPSYGFDHATGAVQFKGLACWLCPPRARAAAADSPRPSDQP